MSAHHERLELKLKTILKYAPQFHDGAIKVTDTLESSVLMASAATNSETPAPEIAVAVFNALMAEYIKVEL